MNIHLMTVKNDTEGQTLIKLLRKSLKGTQHRIKLRGRGARLVHVKNPDNYWEKKSLTQDLPLSLSTSFAVYLEPKKSSPIHWENLRNRYNV